MSAHTPGPWTYGKRRDGSIWLSLGDPMRGPHFQGDLCGSPADARLIAAAPDLLQTLRDAAGEFHDIAHSSGDPSDPANMETPAVMYRVCMEAIARAEGTP